MFFLNPSEAPDLSVSTEGLPWEMCPSYVSGDVAWVLGLVSQPGKSHEFYEFSNLEWSRVDSQPKSHSRTPLKCWIWQCFAIRMFWISLVSEICAIYGTLRKSGHFLFGPLQLRVMTRAGSFMK